MGEKLHIVLSRVFSRNWTCCIAELRHSIIQGTLYIKNVIVSDNGIYVCTVTTNQGTAQAAVTLNVKGKNKI